MRVKFEHVRHDDQIDAVRGKGKLAQIAEHIDPAMIGDCLPQRNAVLRQQGVLRQADLQGVVAKDVDDLRINAATLPSHYVAPLRRLQPGFEAGN